MQRFKKILYRIFHPPALLVLLLVVLSVAALIWAFLPGHTASPLDYAAYMLAFYTLVALILYLPDLLGLWRKLKAHNRLIHRLLEDARFRLKVTLYTSLTFNTAYALFQLGMGLYYRSRWFYALAVYYILLTVMRFFLLRDLHQLTPGEDYREELHRYRFCGVALAAMTPALIVIVAFIVWQNRGFAYHSITTIAMAAYTFGAFAMATVNIVKYRKYHSPLLSAAKAVSLTTASVSVLSLETAMLSAFGEESDAGFRAIITGISGVAVCLFVLAMSVYMITHAAKEFKKLKQGEPYV